MARLTKNLVLALWITATAVVVGMPQAQAYIQRPAQDQLQQEAGSLTGGGRYILFYNFYRLSSGQQVRLNWERQEFNSSGAWVKQVLYDYDIFAFISADTPQTARIVTHYAVGDFRTDSRASRSEILRRYTDQESRNVWDEEILAYTYDANSQLTRVARSYLLYNNFNMGADRTGILTHTESFDNLVTINGQRRTSYRDTRELDAAGQLIRRNIENFTYDSQARLTRQVSSAYNPAGQLTLRLVFFLQATGDRWVVQGESFVYDGAGVLTRINLAWTTYGGSSVGDFSSTVLERWDGFKDYGTVSGQRRLLTLYWRRYDPNDAARTLSAQQTIYSYDDQARLTREALTFFDGAGRITGLNTTDYTYDSQSVLVQKVIKAMDGTGKVTRRTLQTLRTDNSWTEQTENYVYANDRLSQINYAWFRYGGTGLGSDRNRVLESWKGLRTYASDGSVSSTVWRVDLRTTQAVRADNSWVERVDRFTYNTAALSDQTGTVAITWIRYAGTDTQNRSRILEYWTGASTVNANGSLSPIVWQQQQIPQAAMAGNPPIRQQQYGQDPIVPQVPNPRLP